MVTFPPEGDLEGWTRQRNRPDQEAHYAKRACTPLKLSRGDILQGKSFHSYLPFPLLFLSLSENPKSFAHRLSHPPA